MPKSSQLIRTAALAFAFFVLASPGFAQIQIPAVGSPAYTQNFNGIGTSATATLPANFKVDKLEAARTVGAYSAAGSATERRNDTDVPSSTTTGIYNFVSGGTANGTDRAVGFMGGTSPKSGNLYIHMTNSTGGNIQSLQIAYDVEKYRNGDNDAGFTVQLYYSTDGSNFTSAGNNFKTSFPDDLGTTGSAATMVDTVPVNDVLITPIAAGSSFYLAFNYSVTTGTTTSSAQALGVDNISVVATPEPTVAGSLLLVLSGWLATRRRRTVPPT